MVDQPGIQMSSEDLELGRVIGGLERSGFDVDRIREIAKKKRKKVSQIVAEALQLYEQIDSLTSTNPECIVIGMRIARELMSESIKIVSDVARLFSSDMVQSLIGAYASAIQQSQPQPQQQTQSVQQVPDDLRSMLIQSIMPVMTQLMSSLLSSLPIYSQTMQQQAKPAKLEGIKVE